MCGLLTFLTVVNVPAELLRVSLAIVVLHLHGGAHRELSIASRAEVNALSNLVVLVLDDEVILLFDLRDQLPVDGVDVAQRTVLLDAHSSAHDTRQAAQS